MIPDEHLWTVAALESGATKAALITVDLVVTDPAFYEICRGNGCGNFGKCYACPPDIGDAEYGERMIRSFRYGLLYQTIGDLEDSYDFEGMAEVSKKHAQTGVRLSAKVREMYKDEFVHLSCGGCHLCEKCAKRDNLPCRHPDLVMPAMEGLGIDVYRTTSSTDLKYINGQNTVTYFGLVLFDRIPGSAGTV